MSLAQPHGGMPGTIGGGSDAEQEGSPVMSPSTPTALYLAALQPRAGKSLVALGILELLSRRIDDIGYFRPVVPSAQDHRIALMRDRYRMGDRAAYAWTDHEVDAMLAQGRTDDVFKGVIAAYRDLAERCGFVLIEGTDQTGTRSALEF
ncbi:MAG TPA: AAA family ATPase, partial [Euzebya sp.]|nr:AAA family ATPase [Euzebya sp.]